ncbi:GDP-fucose protein O-fucosyltransferase 1-like [Watersipora subatra]|uniref:GDP-fucose protein O-fucosyltransferase 1-like n=1 Tax=Watersipora subatra TaxID=2589382 RepID=UPI00355B4334
MLLIRFVLVILWLIAACDKITSLQNDYTGYIIYCPCMGRFGNQADHLLGSLAFAHKLRRTLVLPAWPTMRGFVEFDEWFDIDILQTHQKVVTADTFIKDIAPQVWPVGKRVGFCYKPAHGSYTQDKCDLKQGSPFSDFWDHLNVDFDSTEFYHLTYSAADIDSWKELYPVNKYPVLAFRGAPAKYPVLEENVKLQRYLWWSNQMVEAASRLIYSHLQNESYIAVHLRNGPDWDNACSHVPERITFMSSPQCTGYSNKHPLSMNMCLPDVAHVLQRIREAVLLTKITNIYVLTDQYPLISDIEHGLSDLGVKAIHADPDIPQYDLIIAAKADFFIGNCISSFSAFIKRERQEILNKTSWFFGIDSNSG